MNPFSGFNPFGVRLADYFFRQLLLQGFGGKTLAFAWRSGDFSGRRDPVSFNKVVDQGGGDEYGRIRSKANTNQQGESKAFNAGASEEKEDEYAE